MSIRIVLTPNQERALTDIEEGRKIHPTSRRSLSRLGFLTSDGKLSYTADMYRKGHIAYKPERGRS